jgi:hypothetical protein
MTLDLQLRILNGYVVTDEEKICNKLRSLCKEQDKNNFAIDASEGDGGEIINKHSKGKTTVYNTGGQQGYGSWVGDKYRDYDEVLDDLRYKLESGEINILKQHVTVKDDFLEKYVVVFDFERLGAKRKAVFTCAYLDKEKMDSKEFEEEIITSCASIPRHKNVAINLAKYIREQIKRIDLD